MSSFLELGVHPALAEALAAEGKTSPFPIQVATLPDAINGRDVLGRGQTGSGKTLAFGLAMMSRLAGRQAQPHRPLGLILSPTRELAVQINDVVGPLARRVNLGSQVVAGGLSYTGQIAALKRGVPIIVATPGRLIDLLNKGHIVLDDVEVTVLDEADQMADMGFLPVVKEILEQTQAGGQRLLFSATLDRDVDSLVKRFLNNPITHSLENEKSRSENMLHHAIIIEQQHKDVVATQIAAREGRTIFFVRTKHGADKLADKMLQAGVPVGVLHGGKSQGQRTRVLAQFKDGRANALVATDVAARGIHVDGVSLVVHIDPPADHKDYLHRAGRTARAGATGVVVSLATHRQRKEVFGITKRAGVHLNEVTVRPLDETLIELTGAQEPSGIPVIVEAEKPGRNDRGSRDRGDRGGFRRGSSSNFKKRTEGGGRWSDETGAQKAEKAVRSFRGATVQKPAYERSEKPARDFNAERPARTNRPTKFGRPVRDFSSEQTSLQRPERSERSERSERFERPSRDERPVRSENVERPDRSERSERSERVERPATAGRTPFGGRPAGGYRNPRDRFNVADKGPGAKKAPARAHLSHKDDAFEKSDRPAKSDRFARDDRPARNDGPDRGGRTFRDDHRKGGTTTGARAGASARDGRVSTWKAEGSDSPFEKSTPSGKPAFKKSAGKPGKSGGKKFVAKSAKSGASKPGAKKFSSSKPTAKAGKPAGKSVGAKKPRTK
jgi:superfamily II DNA/RNA helicase